MPTPALYVADFWIYLESGALDGKFRFVYPGTTAVPSAYGDWLEPTCDLSSVKQGEWVKVTTGVPGDIAQEIKSVIRFMYTPSSDVVFYVDDFSVRSVDEVPPTVNPELDNYFGFERSNMPGNGSEKHQAGWWIQHNKVMSATATSIESAEAKSSEVFTYGNEVSIIGAADKTVKVYTTSGALIYTKTINSNNEKLNLSQSGIYLIDIEGEKVQKVVLNL